MLSVFRGRLGRRRTRPRSEVKALTLITQQVGLARIALRIIAQQVYKQVKELELCTQTVKDQAALSDRMRLTDLYWI